MTGNRMTNWVEIGALNDIPRLGARVVRTASGNIAVFRTEDDEVFAAVFHAGSCVAAALAFCSSSSGMTLETISSTWTGINELHSSHVPCRFLHTSSRTKAEAARLALWGIECRR